MLSIMGERERTQEYGNAVHCHVCIIILSPNFKKTQPYLVIYMYNIPRYNEYTISQKHIAQYGITGYEYFHNYNYVLSHSQATNGSKASSIRHTAPC